MRQPDAAPDGTPSEGETLAHFAVVLAAQRGQISGLNDKVDQLAGDVAALTAASPKGPPMIGWHDLDEDEAAAIRADLAQWVDGTLFRIYPSARDSIRDCWQAHPDAVTELSAAWLEFRRIFGSAPPAAPGKPTLPRGPSLADTLTFLDRWLPGALRRVRQVTEKCTGIDGHTAGLLVRELPSALDPLAGLEAEGFRAGAPPAAGRFSPVLAGLDVVAGRVLGRAAVNLLPDVVKVIALAQGRDNRQRLIHRQRARRDCPCSSDGAWVWTLLIFMPSRVAKRAIKIRNEAGG